jgi:ABC-2 type transport system ATP-binding protein
LSDSSLALSLTAVRKCFGDTVAVDDVNLSVPRGALYGIIGPNGSGKTTCIRMVMGILFPDAGELSVLGKHSALEAKNRVGYLPEERGVYRKMRVGAFITYLARLKGMEAAEASRRVPGLLEQIGLSNAEMKRCEDLSKGMLQRAQFVATVIHRPDLLILDEPFSGLDPVSVKAVRDYVLEEHRRGVTILLSTHVMAHAEELCQHVVMLYRGRKVLDQGVSTLRRQFEPRTILLEPLDPSANLDALTRIPGIERVERVRQGAPDYRVLLSDDADAPAYMARLAAELPVARMELSRLRLDDIFVRIVTAGESGVDASEARRELAREPAGATT